MCNCSNTHAIPAAQTKFAGVRFQVEDMTCAHCAGTIRTALRDGIPGAEFTVDLDSHTVTVAGDPARAEAIIRDAGYEPKRLIS